MPLTIMQQTQNINVEGLTALLSPRTLETAIPATEQAYRTVIDGREAIKKILSSADQRLLVVVGPCSIHNPDAARDYAQRLARLSEQVRSHLCIVMRVYFEKPRTTTGWKGLINDPRLDDSFDMEEGLRQARMLLRDICEMGLPTATEMLDPITPQYIDDLICWGSIGARTIESQTHRQMASGLSMPVGFKNSTDGNLHVAINAMKSARSPHRFLGIDEEGRTCIVATRGNQHGHLILRGGSNGPNYKAQQVNAASTLLKQAGLNHRLIVDCSHANSRKQCRNQAAVFRDLVEQFTHAQSPVIGGMIESFLVEGRQDIPEDKTTLTYGQSITDECIGWDQTEQLLLEAAHTIARS